MTPWSGRNLASKATLGDGQPLEFEDVWDEEISVPGGSYSFQCFTLNPFAESRLGLNFGVN